MVSELADWPTEHEAAHALHVNVKTIKRYAAKGVIEMRKRPRRGNRPANVCNPQDIEKLTPAAPRFVFTLKEAASSGFSVAYLRRAVAEGRLRAFRDGRTLKVSRTILQEFARRETGGPPLRSRQTA